MSVKSVIFGNNKVPEHTLHGDQSSTHSKNMSRYDSVLINRLRIGHSRLTHSHSLCGDDPPTCQLCGLPVSVRHILVECVGLWDIRTKYFTVSSVVELFQSVHNSIVINFIKEAHFYHHL